MAADWTGVGKDASQKLTHLCLHEKSSRSGLQALSSENLLSAFSEDAPHRYRSDPLPTSIGFTCLLLFPSCSTELRRVKYVPLGMI